MTVLISILSLLIALITALYLRLKTKLSLVQKDLLLRDKTTQLQTTKKEYEDAKNTLTDVLDRHNSTRPRP